MLLAVSVYVQDKVIDILIEMQDDYLLLVVGMLCYLWLVVVICMMLFYVSGYVQDKLIDIIVGRQDNYSLLVVGA